MEHGFLMVSSVCEGDLYCMLHHKFTYPLLEFPKLAELATSRNISQHPATPRNISMKGNMSVDDHKYLYTECVPRNWVI